MERHERQGSNAATLRAGCQDLHSLPGGHAAGVAHERLPRQSVRRCCCTRPRYPCAPAPSCMREGTRSEGTHSMLLQVTFHTATLPLSRIHPPLPAPSRCPSRRPSAPHASKSGLETSALSGSPAAFFACAARGSVVRTICQYSHPAQHALPRPRPHPHLCLRRRKAGSKGCPLRETRREKKACCMSSKLPELPARVSPPKITRVGG